jgi:hypothetical protein
MGFGNMFKRVMQMRKDGSAVGQLGKRLMKEGGEVKKMAKGGSASSRADGCAQRGKTKGKMV